MSGRDPAPGPEPRGLDAEVARARLATEGPNELATADRRGLVQVAREVMTEPMIALLVVAGLIYLTLGEPRDAFLLLASIAIIIGVTIYQDQKAESALQALRRLADPFATVLRGGQRLRIPRREVVREDLLIVGEGERVPADALVLASADLQVDESLLTGESVPVAKTVGAPGEPLRPPGGEGSPFVFAGTLVVRGSGHAQVVGTGAATALGRIGESLRTLQPEPTTLQRDSRKLVRGLAVAALVLCLTVGLLWEYHAASWVQGLLAGVTLAMALIPEEIPLVLTIFLALGAWRIGQKRVLTRRFAAIEGLGSATVLCVDKTGTVTENRMSVAAIRTLTGSWRAGTPWPRDEASLGSVLPVARLATDVDSADPMELAIERAALGGTGPPGASATKGRLLRRYPVGPDHLRLAQVWTGGTAGAREAAVKGAPESVLPLCALSATEREVWSRSVEEMTQAGLRVLAVARAPVPPGALPPSDAGFPFELQGLLGLADPVRREAPGAVRLCRRAGIRVVMITGDYPSTARAIARTIGLDDAATVLTGEELARLAPAELERKVRRISVFARIRPEQKLQIVRALQHGGDIVAMTGDGVNDAPALRAAHIGVAMGERGTDVAREAAGLVLLDDSFPALAEAVAVGRRIYDNVRKAVTYLLAVHVPIAGIALLPVVLGMPLVLYPIHVLFLEFIIDPTVTVAFEAEPAEPDVMDRPPRDPKVSLYGGGMLGLSLGLGFGALLATSAVFLGTLGEGGAEPLARTLAFCTLVSSNLALMFVSRSRAELRRVDRPTSNPYLLPIVGIVAMALAAALYVPMVGAVFEFVPPTAEELALAVGLGALGGGWFELVKLWRGWRAAPVPRGDVPGGTRA